MEIQGEVKHTFKEVAQKIDEVFQDLLQVILMLHGRAFDKARGNYDLVYDFF